MKALSIAAIPAVMCAQVRNDNFTKERIKRNKVKTTVECDFQSYVQDDSTVVQGKKVPYENMIPKNGTITMQYIGVGKNAKERDKVYYEDKSAIPAHPRTYFYDSHNELIFREIVKTITSSYDKNGNITGQTYDNPGVTGMEKVDKYSVKFIYSPSGELTETDQYDGSGTLVQKTDEKAEAKKDTSGKKDSKGNIVLWYGFDQDGKYRYRYIYDYDQAGNIIKEKIMEARESDGYKQETTSQQISYQYKNGKKTEEQMILGENGTKIVYTYDGNGNTLTHSEYNSGGGELFALDEFKYNEKGLITESISYSVSGKNKVANRKEVFEYKYY